MATRTKTTRFAFATRIADVATATVLASSARHDFSAITIYVPETTRTFKKVELMVTWEDATTAAGTHNVTAWLLGIKINAVAFNDVTFTSDAVNSGEVERMKVTRDVTSYFTTNDPGTSSFTAQVGVQVEISAGADAIRGITAELRITYDYDDSASTQIKTVCIPIQGHATRLGTSYAEIGTDGTTPCPANQIPILTGGSGLLPENSVVIRDQFLIITANDGQAGTTDLVMTVRLDGATDLARFSVEMGFASGKFYYDIIDKSLMPSTTAAHAVECKSNVASSFEHVSAILVVTYEFNPSATTTVLNSVMVPFENERSVFATLGGSPTGANADQFAVSLNIQEPGTITMKQSGLVASKLYQGNAITCDYAAAGQTPRPFTCTNSITRDSGNLHIMRTDHSSSTWALTRGLNKLRFTVSDSAIDEKALTGYAILNYTSGKAAQGCGAHNRTIGWFLKNLDAVSNNQVIVTPTAPAIAESQYQISGVMFEVAVRNILTTLQFGASRETGEDGASGWRWRTFGRNLSSTEIGFKEYIVEANRWFRDGTIPATFSGQASDIEATRDYYFSTGVAGQVAQYDARAWITYHSITFTVAGTVTVDGTAQVGVDVVVSTLRNTNGDYNRVVGVGSTDGSGNYSIEVSESDFPVFAWFEDDSINQGKSPSAVPGSGAFDIEISTGGSGETTPPVVSFTYPTVSTDPLVVNIYDADSVLRSYEARFRLPGSWVFVMYDDDAGFYPPFDRKSTVTGAGTFADPKILTIYKYGGWPTGIANVEVPVKVIDGAGNEQIA